MPFTSAGRRSRATRRACARPRLRSGAPFVVSRRRLKRAAAHTGRISTPLLPARNGSGRRRNVGHIGQSDRRLNRSNPPGDLRPRPAPPLRYEPPGTSISDRQERGTEKNQPARLTGHRAVLTTLPMSLSHPGRPFRQRPRSALQPNPPVQAVGSITDRALCASPTHARKRTRTSQAGHFVRREITPHRARGLTGSTPPCDGLALIGDPLVRGGCTIRADARQENPDARPIIAG